MSVRKPKSPKQSQRSRNVVGDGAKRTHTSGKMVEKNQHVAKQKGLSSQTRNANSERLIPRHGTENSGDLPRLRENANAALHRPQPSSTRKGKVSQRQERNHRVQRRDTEPKAADSLKTGLRGEQGQKRRANVRERFGKDWDVVLQGTAKTRKIPVRILAIVFTCLIAVIILANPVQDFLAQQEEKRALSAKLTETKAELDALQQQIDLWNDPSYVQAQARKRLGFVLPGQTLYYVSGELTDAEKKKKASEEERAIALRRKSMPFYLGLWKSIEIAGTVELKPEALLNPEDAPLVNEPQPDTGSAKVDTPK